MSGLTLQGDFGGSIGFIAPEQITRFREVKPPADQYSLAATLYFLLTGHTTFDFTGRVEQRLLAILQEEPVPIHTRRQEVPQKLAEIIHRALARDPGDRFSDVKNFRAVLASFR